MSIICLLHQPRYGVKRYGSENREKPDDDESNRSQSNVGHYLPFQSVYLQHPNPKKHSNKQTKLASS